MVYTLLEVICVNLISVAECAAKWGVAERTVRNYCAHDRIADKMKKLGLIKQPAKS